MEATPDHWHTAVPLTRPSGWTLHVSHNDHVSRLVVFVHGFNGEAQGTWVDFQSPPADSTYWREADMLFVAYDSVRENIGAVASRLRREISEFFPTPRRDALVVNGSRPRDDLETPYDELVLVGHSLGGVVIRRALCDAAQMKDDGEGAAAILAASVRLFSPASAGFQAAGLLGALRSTSLWKAVEFFLSGSSAYAELQPGSATLTVLRERTESYAERAEFVCLRARIAWANPDNVVITERYLSDYVDQWWDGTSHSSVCKPRLQRHELPWRFVESGRA